MEFQLRLQYRRIFELSDGERYVDVPRDALDERGERLAAFMARRDVEEDELVGSLARIFRPELDRVTHILDVDEVDTFDGLPVSDVKAWYYTFGEHSYFGFVIFVIEKRKGRHGIRMRAAPLREFSFKRETLGLEGDNISQRPSARPWRTGEVKLTSGGGYRSS